MEEVWHGGHNALADPEERGVLFAALDSFRWVLFADLGT